MKEYKIDILATPHYYDNPKQPYFWSIKSIIADDLSSDWCMEQGGWAASIEKAFSEANSYLNTYHICKYEQVFPHDDLRHCMAYSKSKRKDNLFWDHYPVCCNENCPLTNPDLLEGAELVDD